MLSIIDGKIIQKIFKDSEDLIKTVNQHDLNLPPKPTNVRLFSRTSGTFSKIDHMIGHKTNLKNGNQ